MNLWKNKHDFLYPVFKVKQPSELEVKLMLKWDQLGGSGGANFPAKEPQTWWAPGGGGANYDNHDDDDDNDDNDFNDDYDDHY